MHVQVLEVEIKQPKEKASYSQKNKRIKQLEDELRRIRSEYNSMKEELSQVKGSPLVLLKPAISPEIAYNLMVEQPESARFIYKKYRDLKSVIEEVCDPENPLYKKAIADNLKDRFEVRQINDDILKLRSEKLKLEEEKRDTEKYIEKLGKNADELNAQLKPKQDEIENLHKLIANLKSDPVMERLNKILNDMDGFAKMLSGIKPDVLNGDKILKNTQWSSIDAIQKSILEFRNFMETDDYFSDANVDEKRKENIKIMKDIGKSNQSYISDDMHKKDEEMMVALQTMAKVLGDGKGALSRLQIQGLTGNVWDMIEWMTRKQTLKKHLADLLRNKDKDDNKDKDYK